MVWYIAYIYKLKLYILKPKLKPQNKGKNCCQTTVFSLGSETLEEESFSKSWQQWRKLWTWPILLIEMVEELTRLWTNFSLTKDEWVVVEIQRDALKGIEKRGQSYQVGKLIDDYIVCKGIIRSTLVQGFR